MSPGYRILLYLKKVQKVFGGILFHEFILQLLNLFFHFKKKILQRIYNGENPKFM